MQMHLQKVISKKNFKKKQFFVDVLKVTDENSRIRIRIHETDVWIRGSGSTPQFAGSATLVVPGVLAAGQEDGQALLLGEGGL